VLKGFTDGIPAVIPLGDTTVAVDYRLRNKPFVQKDRIELSSLGEVVDTANKDATRGVPEAVDLPPYDANGR
jgi:hypothetical protein